MRQKFVMVIAAIAGVASPAWAEEGPIATTGGPELNFVGCRYYWDAEFGGESRDIPAGVWRRYVGDHWNDEISSIACHENCSLTVFEHRDYGGAWRRWTANMLYVGDAWNDDISSMKISCS